MLWIEGGKKQHLHRGLKTMKTTNISHERLSHGDLKRRFPMFRLPDDCEGVLEHEGYDMYASRCLHALQVYFILSLVLSLKPMILLSPFPSFSQT